MPNRDALAGIVLAKAEPPSDPGTLIASVEVPIRPVPWKAPTVTRTGHSFKDKRLVSWQDDVKKCARIAMGRRLPYAHPVRLEFRFDLAPSRNGSVPDLSNLVKSTEDALQQIVIVNDRQVCRIASERTLGATDMARIDVYAWGDA